MAIAKIAFPGFQTPAAGFEVPLEMLSACHGRVERQCQTMLRLVPHLAANGPDQAAREALALYCCGPAGGGGVRWRTTPRIRTQSYLMLPGDLAPGCRVQSAAEIAA